MENLPGNDGAQLPNRDTTKFSNKNDSLTPESNIELFYGLKGIQEHSTWFLGVGIALIILGMIAMAASPFVTLASMLFFGAIMIAGGIVQVVNAFKTRHGDGFLLNLLGGIFYTVVGILLILHPLEGALAATLLLAAFFSVTGIFKIVASLVNRFGHWGWVLLNGIVSLALGIMILLQWPTSGLFIIGLFIGIDLLMLGWVWVALSLSTKKVETFPK